MSFHLSHSIERRNTAFSVSLQHYLLIDKRDPQAERDNLALAWSPGGTHVSLLVARSGCIQAWTRTTTSSSSNAWHSSFITSAVANLGTCLLAAWTLLSVLSMAMSNLHLANIHQQSQVTALR